MSDPEFSTGSGFASSAGGAAARGAILVGLAVLLGFLLLQRNDDQSDLVQAPDSTIGAAPVGTDTGAAPTGTSAPVTTAPVLPAPRPNEEVSVLVVNGARVGGAAGDLSSRLNSLAYITLVASDIAEGEDVLAESQIAFAPGFESEARALADDRGIPQTAVAPLPLTVQTTSDEVDVADVVVVLGRDLAGDG